MKLRAFCSSAVSSVSYRCRVGRELFIEGSTNNSPPLIERDGRISRITLSEAVHRRSYRARALCPATQCPLKPSSVLSRSYLPEGSHRCTPDFAVHADQAWSLCSAGIGRAIATTNHSDFSPSQTSLAV